jgi:hypothetical protein
MAEIAVVGFRVDEQLLGSPAVGAGVMGRLGKIAEIDCAGVKQTRGATEKRDRQGESCESTHHP